ncbi:MAG: DUF5312 domain-containing protein [Treponema sp.]|nr:DUF5312 domain-containing protein [Treponema sp.]
MLQKDNKDAFDKLIAGLSADERREMLNRINANAPQTVQFVDVDDNIKDIPGNLQLRLNNESVIYKFLLWVRSVFSKRPSEKIYNDDLLLRIAKKVNKEHPGLINHHAAVLDSVFYERLRTLKDAADFFKPYFSFVDAAQGEFYVFLSSFVVPELSDRINRNADPFTLPFSRNPTPDVKTELLRKLDDLLNGIEPSSRTKLYYAISSLNWLKQYTRLPFIHFSSQFTNIAGANYTCPYGNAVNDYDVFGSLFAHVTPISSESLEALYLFSQKKDLTSNAQSKDIERAVKEFMAVANSHLATIQMFITGVPVIKVGKLVNLDYDWEPGNTGGAEAWFPSFRSHWRKILEVRWNDWLRERKKNLLSASLKNDFGLNSFPTMLYAPWKKLWSDVSFAYELTGGFISWFAMEKYDEIINIMNDVMLEGIFLRSENRQEYSEGMNNFVNANKKMQELIEKLSPSGAFGLAFEEIATSKIRTLQVQNQIDSMMSSTETDVADIYKKFVQGAKQIDDVYKGFFEDVKDGVHESLQNWTSIKGHQNREWRDKLRNIFIMLKRVIFYLSELEPIDQAIKNER